MRPPVIGRGHVEQFLYTWSSRNLDGREGYGFGAASPLLRDSLNWLSDVDPTAFALHGAPSAKPGQPAHTRRDLTALGRVRFGDLAMIFRKVAPAGFDPHDRPRHLVHGFVGAWDELTYPFLQTVNDDVWLTAEACPLDRQPTLSGTTIDGLRRASKPTAADVESADAIRDTSEAEKLVLRLAPGTSVRLAESESGVVDAALRSLPAGLAAYVDVVPYLQPDGGFFEVRVNDLAPPDTTQAQLKTRMQAVQRGLQKGKAGEIVLAATTRQPDPLQVLVRTFGLADPSKQPISAASAGDLVVALESSAVPPDRFLGLSPAELKNALGNATDENALVRFGNYLGAGELDRLSSCWASTSMAALGFAVAVHKDGTASADHDLDMPDKPNASHLDALARAYMTHEDGTRLLASLVGGAARGGRLRSLAPSFKGHTPYLFGEVVPAARLTADDVRVLVRALPDEFCIWAGLSPLFTEALNPLLAPRRRRPLGTVMRLLAAPSGT